VTNYFIRAGSYTYTTKYNVRSGSCVKGILTVTDFSEVSSIVVSGTEQLFICTNNMTAHLCAHPGVRSAPSNWGSLQKSGARGHSKKLCPHFQFASGATGLMHFLRLLAVCCINVKKRSNNNKKVFKNVKRDKNKKRYCNSDSFHSRRCCSGQ